MNMPIELQEKTFDKFIFVNPPKNTKSSSERVFIYALLLHQDLQSAQEEVIYIGKAEDLNRRLANHYVARWHYQEFSEPVRVYIIGTIAKGIAETATGELVKSLADRGNHVLPKVKKESELHNLKLAIKNGFAEDRIELYLHIDNWATKNEIKGRKIVPPTKREKLTQAEKIDIDSVSKTKISSIYNTRWYPRMESIKASQALGRSYDAKAKMSYVVFKVSETNPRKAEVQKKQIADAVKDLENDWILLSEVSYNKPTFFAISESMKRLIKKRTEPKEREGEDAPT